MQTLRNERSITSSCSGVVLRPCKVELALCGFSRVFDKEAEAQFPFLFFQYLPLPVSSWALRHMSHHIHHFQIIKLLPSSWSIRLLVIAAREPGFAQAAVGIVNEDFLPPGPITITSTSMSARLEKHMLQFCFRAFRGTRRVPNDTWYPLLPHGKEQRATHAHSPESWRDKQTDWSLREL